MAAYLYSDIFKLLTNFKQSADRSWLETPPQTFMQNRWHSFKKMMHILITLTLVLTILNSGKAQDRRKLIKELDEIYVSDQSIRKQIGQISKEYGWESPEMKEANKEMNELDSVNLIRVTHILDSIGWQGKRRFGDLGSLAIFLVIQHSDLVTQEKYLPMIRGATKKGQVRKSNLALLEDRVALGQGKKQIYGSQIWRNEETGQFYVAPIEDPDNVDKRRKKMGLRSMAEYVKRWDITWSVQEHKDTVMNLDSEND